MSLFKNHFLVGLSVSLLIVVALSAALSQGQTVTRIDVSKLAKLTDEDYLRTKVVFKASVGSVQDDFKPAPRNQRAGEYKVYPTFGDGFVTVRTGDLPRPAINVEITGIVRSLNPTVVEEVKRVELTPTGATGGGALGNLGSDYLWLIIGGVAVLVIILATALYLIKSGKREPIYDGGFPPLAGVPGHDGLTAPQQPAVGLGGGTTTRPPDIGVIPVGPVTRGAQVATLRVIQGGDGVSAYPVTQGSPLVIGRSGDILRDSPDQSISGTHAEIEVHGTGECVLSDRGSRNGTFVNSTRITSPHPLRAGDKIQVGSTLLEFETTRETISPRQGQVPSRDTETRAPIPAVGAAPQGPSLDAATRVAQLRIIEGPEKGQVFPLIGGENKIGRSGDNSIVLTEGSVGRQHAILRFEQGKMTLRDVSSYQATYVNDKKHSEGPLANGDKIRLGDSTLLLYEGP